MNSSVSGIWRNKLLNSLFPQRCVLCKQTLYDRSIDLCSGCQQDLPAINTRCHHCGIPLPENTSACGQCQKKPPRFDHVFSLFHYQQPVSWLIRQMKFKQKASFAHLLGQLLGQKLLEQAGPLPDVIIPVPLHYRRQFQRGFNQAEEVAKSAATLLNLSVDNQLIQRLRDNRHQSGLDARARRKNVRGIFTINPKNTGKYQHVAVVDDVLSTGSTAAEIARVLKRAGVKRVDVWVIARADAP